MQSSELNAVVVHEAVLNLVSLLRLLNNCCFNLSEERLQHENGQYMTSIFRGSPKDGDQVPFTFEWRSLTRELFLYSLDERVNVCLCVPVSWRMADDLSTAIVRGLNRDAAQPRSGETVQESHRQPPAEGSHSGSADGDAICQETTAAQNYDDWRPWELVGC